MDTKADIQTCHPVLFFEPGLMRQEAAKAFFAVKMPSHQRRYPELDIFRQQIEVERQGLHSLPYTSAKKKIMTYKLTFFALALVFIFLGLMTYTKTASWHITTAYWVMAKGLICTFCGVASLTATWLAATMRTEKEAAKHHWRYARYSLAKAYAKKRMEFGLTGLFAFGKAYKKLQILQQAHRDAQDKFHQHHHDLELLFDRIASSTTLNPRSREHLYNQALLEFNDKLHQVVDLFKQMKVQ